MFYDNYAHEIVTFLMRSLQIDSAPARQGSLAIDPESKAKGI